MGGNFYVADTAQLRRPGKELQDSAQQLDRPRRRGRQLSGTIGTSSWKGHDGDPFRSASNAAHLLALEAASSGIGTAAKALLLVPKQIRTPLGTL